MLRYTPAIQSSLAFASLLLAFNAGAMPVCGQRDKLPSAYVAEQATVLWSDASKSSPPMLTFDVGDEVVLIGASTCEAKGSWIQVDSKHCIAKGKIGAKLHHCESYKGWVERSSLSLNDFSKVSLLKPMTLEVSIGDYYYVLHISSSGEVVYTGQEPRTCDRAERPDETGKCWKSVDTIAGQLFQYRNLVVVLNGQPYVEPLFFSSNGRLCSTWCKECCAQ